MTDRAARRVLIVEDDADVREALTMLLDDEGYATTRAASLEDALALVETSTFDLILTDLVGRSAAQPLAGVLLLRERAFPTPVAVTSGWPIAPGAPGAEEFSFVLRKPYDIDDLVAQVAAALDAPLDEQQRRLASVVEAYFAALGVQDWDALAALCVEDVTYVLPGQTPFSGTVIGRDALRRYSAETFAQFPCVRFENVHVYATPRGLAARYLGSWLEADGQRARMGGAVVFAFADERIRQIGVRLNDERLRALLAAR